MFKVIVIRYSIWQDFHYSCDTASLCPVNTAWRMRVVRLSFDKFVHEMLIRKIEERKFIQAKLKIYIMHLDKKLIVFPSKQPSYIFADH